METKQVMDALEAWATETVADLESYDHPPESLTQALPLVIAEITRDAVGGSDQPRMQQLQQKRVRVWSVRLLLLVSPDPAWTASQTLYDIVDQLGSALRSDGTLGGRVQYAGPNYQADYEPAEVEWEPDGSIARSARFGLTVAEQVSPH